VAAFNKRAAEMDSDTSRLALFLDPRFKQLVASNQDQYQIEGLQGRGEWLACLGLH
jgi:hypothetical protein